MQRLLFERGPYIFRSASLVQQQQASVTELEQWLKPNDDYVYHHLYYDIQRVLQQNK